MPHQPFTAAELTTLETSLELHGSRGVFGYHISQRLIQEVITLRLLLAGCLHENWQDDPAQVKAHAHLHPRPNTPTSPDDPVLRGQIMHTLDLARHALTTQQIHQIVGRDPADALARMEALGQVRSCAHEGWALTPAPCG